MSAVGIVLASGSGQRFDAKGVPKHLTLILDIPIIIWTLSTIIKSEVFSSLIVVTREQDIINTTAIIDKYISQNVFPIRVTAGSSERMQSFFLGIDDLVKADLIEDDSIIGLFDANRPFTPIGQLYELYRAAAESGCSCPVRKVVNGIAQIRSGKIVSVPDKSRFVEFVTPEFISFGILKEYIGRKANVLSSLVEYSLASKVEPSICDASVLNAKLTFPEDKTYLEGMAIDNNISTIMDVGFQSPMVTNI